MSTETIAPPDVSADEKWLRRFALIAAMPPSAGQFLPTLGRSASAAVPAGIAASF